MKKMDLKKLACAILAVMMLFTLVACGGDGTDSAAPSTAGEPNSVANDGPAAEPTEGGSLDRDLIVARWAGPIADDQKTVAKEYPNGTVVIDDVDYANLKQKEMLGLQAEVNDYDLMYVQGDWIVDFALKGFLTPLNDYIEAAGIDLSVYNQDLLDMCTVDGVIYALPDFAQTHILTINTEWFEREGQKIPTTPDELLEVAKYFKEQGTGIAIPGKQTATTTEIFSHLLFSAGGDFWDEEGNITLDTPEALAAMEYWDELFEYAMDGSANWHVDDTSQMVREGVAPFNLSISGLSGLDMDPEQSVISESVAYAIIPPLKSNVGCVSLFNYAIPSNVENPQASFDLLTWMCSPEVGKQQTLMNGFVSGVTTYMEDEDVVAKYPFMPVTGETLAQARLAPYSLNGLKLVDSLIVSLSNLAASNDSTPQEVLEATQAEFEGINMLE